MMKKLFSLFAAFLFVGTMWATSDYTKNNNNTPYAFDKTNGCSGWTGTNIVSGGYCGAYSGKNNAWTVYNASISEFGAVNFSLYKNVSLTIYVTAGTNGGTNSYTVKLIDSEGAQVSTYSATKVDGMGSGTNASSARESSISFEPTEAFSGCKVEFPAKAFLTSIRYVLTYDNKAVCANTVTITKGTESNGTFSLSTTSVCGDGDGGEVQVADIVAADGFRFKEISSVLTSDGTTPSGTVNNSTKLVTGITADVTIKAVFEEIPKYTVSFNTGTGNPAQTDITEASAGAGITLPAGPTPACSTDGWNFAGWAETAVDLETDNAPTLLKGTYYPTNNITLYAVYKKNKGTTFEGYTQITSTPDDWSGIYLLSTGTYTATGEYSSNHLTVTSYTPSTEEKLDYEFTLTKVANGKYSILLPDGENYLGYSGSGANFSKSTTEPTSSSNAYLWNPTTELISNVGTNDRKLYTNGNQTDIRPYQNLQTGGAVVYLFKRGAGGSHFYYLSAPTCEPTDIEETVDSSVKSIKFIQNGQLFIEKNGRTYNAQGQLVK